MHEVYLIIQNDFDAVENHDPYYSTVLGYVNTEAEAKEFIKLMHPKKYKGWDGRIYPKYTTQLVKKL